MRIFLRLLRFASFPFLVLSLLLLCGMAIGLSFIVEFRVENRSDVPIVVTPVGTVGPAGHKEPLPVTMSKYVRLPALRGGGFRLLPGESISIQYDMDDINFSEIVVSVDPGRILQLVTDPNPTADQYHGPRQQEYVIDDLSQLGPAPPNVIEAARAANRQWAVACIMMLLIVGPWPFYAFLVWQSRRCNRREKGDRPPASAVRL